MSDVRGETPGGEPAEAEGQGQQEPEPLRCDFCGKPATRVRRIALDRGYDRLQVPHAVRYACPECSEAKERSRQARG